MPTEPRNFALTKLHVNTSVNHQCTWSCYRYHQIQIHEQQINQPDTEGLGLTLPVLSLRARTFTSSKGKCLAAGAQASALALLCSKQNIPKLCGLGLLPEALCTNTWFVMRNDQGCTTWVQSAHILVRLQWKQKSYIPCCRPAPVRNTAPGRWGRIDWRLSRMFECYTSIGDYRFVTYDRICKVSSETHKTGRKLRCHQIYENLLQLSTRFDNIITPKQ